MNNLFDVLKKLRTHCGDSKFGYRIEALLANVFVRIGGEILEMNPQGHPDFRLRLNQRVLLIQAKSRIHSSPEATFTFCQDDIDGIHPGELEEGYLAVLDCARPTRWYLVNYEHARTYAGRSVPFPALESSCDLSLSSEIENEFAKMIFDNQEELNDLNYRYLCKSAQTGKPL